MFFYGVEDVARVEQCVLGGENEAVSIMVL